MRRGGEKGGSPETAPDEPEDHALGRSRGGYGTKLHVVSDGKGHPLAVEVSPGQCHESTYFEDAMNTVRIPQPKGPPRRRPGAVAGDKAYGCRHIRDWLKDHRIKDVIPTKSNQEPNPDFDKEAYRKRNVVERCIGALKECRRIATRFEKLAVNFLAMVKLAMMRLYFRDLIDKA